MMGGALRRAWMGPFLALAVVALLLGATGHDTALGEPASSTTTSAVSAPSSSSSTTIGIANVEAPQPPTIHAAAAFLVNAGDNRVLYQKNADARRAMASTTKIMTGILAVETLPLDKKVKASKRAANTEESQIYLTAGEELTVEELLYALMVKSANDAAVALAEASAGTVEAFVANMNAKAVELGLSNTHFTNPHGLDQPGHYSSARDLATLSCYALKNPTFSKLVDTNETTIPWPGHDAPRELDNHNVLLDRYEWVDGVKTGFTNDAGFCLVSSGTKDGLSLVGVILGDPQKERVWDESATLLQYGFRRYPVVELVGQGTTEAEIPVPYRLDETLTLVTDQAVKARVFDEDPIERTVDYREEIELPVDAGTVLGSVAFTVGGRPSGEAQLVATRSIPKPTLGVKAVYFWGRFSRWLGRIL